MINSRERRSARTYFVTSVLALALAGCGGSGSTRIASIGDVPGATGDSSGGNTGDTSGGNTGGTGSGSDSGSGSGSGSGGTGSGGTGTTPANPATPLGGPILVTAGNAVIGLGNKHDGLAQTVNGKLPVSGPVTGTVTAVLRKTGQTLVDLGNGRSAVLNKAGGAVGRLVTIDLGSGRVIGAPGATSLLGVAALTPTQLAQVSVANPGTGKVGALTGSVGTIASAATGVLSGGATGSPTTLPVTPVTNVVSGKVGKVGAVTGGLLGGATNPAPTPQAPGLTGALGAGLGGAVTGNGVQTGAGVGGLLKIKKH